MGEKSFLKSKAGGLTMAFIAIMIAFVIIMLGLSTWNKPMYTTGLVIIVLAMLYSPFKVYILDRRKR